VTIFPSLRNFGGFFSDYYFTTVFSRSVAGRQKTIANAKTDLAFRICGRLHDRAESRDHDLRTVSEVFARPLLRDAFGYYIGFGDSHVLPLYADAESENLAAPPRLLAYVGTWDEDLDSGTRGKPSAMKQVQDALASSQHRVRYGLLLTGERLRLVRAAGEGPRNAYLELDVEDCLGRDDRESFAAAWRIFSSENFGSSPDGKLPIDAIERESRDYAQRVSDDLKGAVFASAETLVQALLDAWQAQDPYVREPGKLTPVDLSLFRDAALTCLYRLLFVLYAEARDERLLAHPLYRDSYSLAGLLRELVAERVAPSANRYGYWQRTLAMFAIHFGGLPASGGLDPIPARGGSLLDPGTEAGRILDESRLDDASVARLILQLTTTQPRRGVGLERVSFRELDIEQLGAVYEGLLEYEPNVAPETMLEVKLQGKLFALAPRELVRLCQEKDVTLRGDPSFAEGTEAASLHLEAVVSSEAGGESDEEAEVSGGDGDEEDGESEVKRGAVATLIRRLQPGTFHFVPGPARKGSGSFYTPLPLVQDLVRHALGPLIEGTSASKIERLRVLDPACGSAHFLVEAMRFLGRALHRAYSLENGGKAPPHFRGTWDNDFEVVDEEARASGSEARAWCKRRIAEHCLFGVDLNPTAVQLAQVSLWIESLAGERPLSYFEHHVRCGNSLLGTWLERLAEPPLPDMRPKPQAGELDIFAHDVGQRMRDAAKIRGYIDMAADVGAVESESIEEQKYKADRQREADALVASARLLFDMRSASAFVQGIWGEWPTLCGFIGDAMRLEAYARQRPWWHAFQEVRGRQRFFHWEVEFPEVFLDRKTGGFDAVVGNPPWDKIKPDKREFYGTFDVLIRAFVGGALDSRVRELNALYPDLAAQYAQYEGRVRTLAGQLKNGGDYRFQRWDEEGLNARVDPDLFKFFIERGYQLLASGGRSGTVAPSAVYNNESCTGLRHLLLDEAQIERFYGFENRRKVFPIDSRYKFVNLVFRKGGPDHRDFPAAFMRHNLDELADPGSKPWLVTINQDEVKRLSPGTLAFLEYREPRDQEIIRKIYGYSPAGNPVDPRPLLSSRGPQDWDIELYREFHMTDDRDLWTDMKTGKLHNPHRVLGQRAGVVDRPPYYDFDARSQIRALMAEAGFWPLYEGKHIEQLVVDLSPVERWVSLEACQRKYGKYPNGEPKLVVRQISSNTNERTIIAALLPEHSCFGHSLLGLRTSADLQRYLVLVLNSFCFDFLMRLRMTTNVSYYHLDRAALPRVQDASDLSNAIELLVGLPNHPIPDLNEFWPRIWSLNKEVAQCYGLEPEDFAYVLESFPVLARKRAAFFTYLMKEVEIWKAERGVRRPSGHPVLPVGAN